MVEGIGPVDYDKIKNSLQEVAIASEDWAANRSATLDTHGFRQFRIEASGAFATPTNLQLVAVSALDPSLEVVSWTDLPVSINVASFSPPTDSSSTLSTEVTERYSDYRFWKVQFDQPVTGATVAYLGKKAEGIKPSVKDAVQEADLTVTSGTIDVIRTKNTAAGTVVSGPVFAGVSPGTVDVSGADKFSLVMQTRPPAGATIAVENQVREVPGGMWGSVDVVTVKESAPLVTKINDVARDYRPVPESAGTLDVEYRSIV